MTRKRTTMAVVAFILVAMSIYIARAGTSDSTPSAQFIAAALRNQLTVPLEMRYTQKTFADGGVNPISIHYVRIKDAQFKEYEFYRNSVMDYKNSYSYKLNTRESRQLFETSPGVKTGRIAGESRNNAFSRQDQMETAYYCLFDGPICEMVASGSVSPEQEDVDSHKCWRVGLSCSSPAIQKCTIWLDPSIGFCPRQIEIVWTKGDDISTIKFQEYTLLAEGIWFPRKQTIQHPEDKGGITNVCSVDEITCGHKPVSQAMEVNFPSGTLVSNELKDMKYKVP